MTHDPSMHQGVATVKAARWLKAEGSWAKVIDLQALYPCDNGAVLASVEKTGRLVVAHETHLPGARRAMKG